MLYHLSLDHGATALCEEVEAGDVLVPMEEASDPQGRHFNCPRCDKKLHKGQRHMRGPDE